MNKSANNILDAFYMGSNDKRLNKPYKNPFNKNKDKRRYKAYKNGFNF